jgi:hypothetical protein
MKHAVFRRDAIRFNLQVVHAASVQKRDIGLGIINGIKSGNFTFITEIQQQIQASINQAASYIQGVQNQIASAIASTTAGMQTTAATILTQVGNFPGCATAQTANVANMVNQTSMLPYQLF